jgi:isopentenyldiphosphate isomerase
MNQVVIVNEQDKVIGEMSRDEAHKTGTPHRIAVVYVENSKGEILVQVRMSKRLDHSAAGHLDLGETYFSAAERELREELGIEGVALKKIGHGISKDIQSNKGINIFHVFDVFVCRAEPKQLQKEEVLQTFWSDPLKVLEDMKADTDDKYTGGFKASIEVYLEYRKLI